MFVWERLALSPCETSLDGKIIQTNKLRHCLQHKPCGITRNFIHLMEAFQNSKWYEWSNWTRYRVHSISFLGSTPVCPQYVLIASTSFQGLTWVSHKCPACGVGHLGAGPRCMTTPQEGEWSFRLTLVRGSPEWAPQGKHREANRTRAHGPFHWTVRTF